MLKEWYDNGGLEEFLATPFVPGVSRSAVPKSQNVEWDFLSHGAAHAEQAFSPLAKPKSPTTSALAEFQVKSNTVEENFWIVMVCSVASFCRELEVHVDVDGCIGPLVDADSSFHKLGSHLANYQEVFGPNCNAALYLHLLGLEIQRSPLSHPIRAYDANRRWLLSCLGGGHLRASRNGVACIKEDFSLATDHLFQSLIVEVVRVPTLMEWSVFKKNETPGLPGIADIESFLAFLDGVRTEMKWRTMSHILQTQYELHEAFNKPGCRLPQVDGVPVWKPETMAS